MGNVNFVRGDSDTIDNIDIQDGQILFNTDKRTIQMDFGDNRQSYGSADVEITWEEFQALSEEEKNNGLTYYIKDKDSLARASAIDYDQSGSQLGVSTVQGGIDVLANKVNTINNNLNDLREEMEHVGKYPNFSNKLHTFASTTTYTATRDSFIVGTIASGTLAINGYTVASSKSYQSWMWANGSYNSSGTSTYDLQIYLPIKSGDVVTISATNANLSVFACV